MEKDIYILALSLKFFSNYFQNGERYDLTVLLGPLMDVFSRDAVKFKKMHVIKRGTSFMEIRYGFLVLRDFINFSSPIKLG